VAEGMEGESPYGSTFASVARAQETLFDPRLVKEFDEGVRESVLAIERFPSQLREYKRIVLGGDWACGEPICEIGMKPQDSFCPGFAFLENHKTIGNIQVRPLEIGHIAQACPG